MMLQSWMTIAPITGVVALVVALILFLRVKALPAGNARMVEIGGYIREGSMAFLWRQYKILAIYSLVLFVVLGFFLSWVTANAFLLGAVLSIVAGNIGMHAATSGN